MFGKFAGKSTGTYEYLIAGLGNPGQKYETTRHNVGFLCITLLEDKYNIKLKKLKFHSLTGDVVIGGHKAVVIKPQTMMNNSGEAVSACASFYKIPPERIIIISDDISLEPGKVRVRRKGSDGGHNGLKSIISHLGTNEFPRVKIGVGAKPHPDYDLADWVLGNFPKDQIPVMRESIEHALCAVEAIISYNIDEAMQKYNG